MKRAVTIVVAAAMLVLAGTTSAGAIDISPDDGGVKLADEEKGQGPTGSDSNAVYNVPKPYKKYQYIPTCSGNDIELTDDDEIETIGDNLCGAATRTCPTRGDIQYEVFTLQYEADGSVREGAELEPAGTQCRGPDDPPEGGPVQITVADIAAEARKAAPKTVVHVEPDDRSYVNLPTNFYADSETVDASVELLGQTIGLTFAPSDYTWAYGDSSSGNGAGLESAKVGAPGAVEHAYRRSGDVSVTLTRTFDVTFTLPGGQTGTLPAPGVSNISEPYPLQIREIQATVTQTR